LASWGKWTSTTYLNRIVSWISNKTSIPNTTGATASTSKVSWIILIASATTSTTYDQVFYAWIGASNNLPSARAKEDMIFETISWFQNCPPISPESTTTK
jgi:hypothetical protein